MRGIKSQGISWIRDAHARGRGTSRAAAKADRTTDDKIFADSTAIQYEHDWGRYCDWLSQNGIKPKTLAEAGNYMQAYADHLANQPGCRPGTLMSARTVKTYLAPISKITGVSQAGVKTAPCRRADITRSRLPAARDRHSAAINEYHAFACCTGLRARKEMAAMRGTDLVMKNGKYYVAVPSGKGGKSRVAPVVGPEADVRAVVARCRAAGNGLVWDHIPSHADTHSCRAVYAARVYAAAGGSSAAAAATPRAERYDCRGDMAGTHLVRRAVDRTSRALGHGREDVVAQNYSYQFDKL